MKVITVITRKTRGRNCSARYWPIASTSMFSLNSFVISKVLSISPCVNVSDILPSVFVLLTVIASRLAAVNV